MWNKHRFALLISTILLIQVTSGCREGQANAGADVSTNAEQRRSTAAKPSEAANLSVNPAVQSEFLVEGVNAQELNGAEVKGERTRRDLKRNVDKEVKRIVSAQLDVEMRDVRPNVNLVEQLGADSFALRELFSTIEEYFSCKIPGPVARQIRTVQDLIITAKWC